MCCASSRPRRRPAACASPAVGAPAASGSSPARSSAIEATHAPHASEPVDALFELLRFQEGAFTFDAEATHDDPAPPTDVEILLAQAEALLDEWRAIEAVVPSMDAWVTLRERRCPRPRSRVDQARWTTLVAVGGGATVRRIADELCLAELPISRAVKELVELGLVDIADAPAGRRRAAPRRPPPVGAAPADPPARWRRATTSRRSQPTAAAARARAPAAPRPPPAPRRARGLRAARPPRPGSGAVLRRARGAEDEADAEAEPAEVDDLAAAFPGLANRSTPVAPVDVDDEELAKQLATLSPRAASAIRAAAEATTDEERDAALDEVDDEDQPLNRGLLLKFLSSVKS